MRISEEIDALEVMAVPSVPFLITTRVIAGVIAIIPMYTIGLLASFAASRLNVTLINGLPGGTYDHYFDLFLPVSDVLYSYLKVIIFAVVIILIHCHYGYSAKGGPAGVGIAVGRSVRLSIVSTAILDFFLTLVHLRHLRPRCGWPDDGGIGGGLSSAGCRGSRSSSCCSLVGLAGRRSTPARSTAACRSRCRSTGSAPSSPTGPTSRCAG